MKSIVLTFLSVAALCAGADELRPPITQGQRVFTCGHSFHVWVPAIVADLCKKADIPGHKQIGLSSIGGSKVIQHWNIPDEKNTAKAALAKLPGVRLHGLTPVVGMAAVRFGSYLGKEDGVHVAVSSWTRVSDNVIPARGKFAGSYVNSALAKTDAVLAGFDEALLLNDHGHVCEGSVENVFMLRHGVVVTPPVTDDVLEGFTRATVIQLLREYHETVGLVVTKFGGMIKDFAGDGILTLVGAPIPIEDHAERAVAMALEMRSRALEFLRRWKSLGLELGIGIGVASGFVTVGTIGGAGRLEYAAIGPAVNLASRLCDRAWSGQVLVDQRTVGLIGERTKGYTFESLDAIELKGFARAVPISAVVPEGAAPMPLPATT